MHKIDLGMMIKLKDVVFVYQLKNADDIKWHTRNHSHQAKEFELHYFIGGEGHFRVGGTLHTVSPGSLFVCPPRLPHAIEARKDENPISYYAVLFRIEEKQIETDETGDLEALLYTASTKPPRNIGRNYRFFFEELKERSLSPSLLKRQAALHQLLSFLYLIGDGNIPRGEPGNVHLEKALDMMQEKVFGRIKLPELAGELGITESYMIRLFRKKLNITPMKYYTRLKVEAAASLLSETSLAVYEVADRLNFYSEYHFSRVFKHYTGLAPSLYRNEQYHRRSPTGDFPYDNK
ncbi:MAG: AraC family transcriptional regulator [Spirochaetaceae bacterium]|nr:AraC family transcriptional regulator [Spirochaetaceae bacterium]